MRALLAILVVVVVGLAAWFVSDGDSAGGGVVAPRALDEAAATGDSADTLSPGASRERDPGDPGDTSAGERRVIETADTGALADDAPTRAVEVLVRVQQTFRDDAERVPGLGVVVGVARGAAYADGPEGPFKLALARGTSGADGEVLFTLDVPEAWIEASGDDLRLWGHVAHPGKRAYTRCEPFELDERNVLKLFPRGGASIYGRVLRADGSPAHPAEVRLFESGVPEGEWALDEDSEHVDPNGGFRLDADGPGVFDVQVTAPGQGSAGVRGVEIVGDGTDEPLELVLSGDGVIAGVLRDPAGAPVPRYRLWCAPAAHRDVSVGYLHDPVSVPHEWGDGLYGDHGETDEAGRFRFEGLREGAYVVRGHTATTGYYEELLTEVAIPTGTEDAALVLGRHRLLVRVLDHEGARVGVTPEHRPGRRELPPHALYLEECDANGRLLASRRYTHDTRERLANGDLVLDVEAGKRYVLGIVSRECALVEQRVDVTPGEFERVVTVHLPPPEPGTVLGVELQTPTGEPFEGDNAQRLYAPESGRLLWETDDHHDAPRVTVAIGPGRYRWEADAEPSRGHHGERWAATPHAPLREELVVLPGQRNRFERRLGASGRIALRVTPETLRPTLPEKESAEWNALHWQDRTRLVFGGVRVTLEGDAGAVEPVFSYAPGSLDAPMLGTIEGPWIVPGERRETVGAIPPGTYRVVVEADGVGRREATVTVVAGETAEVTVAFE